MIENVISEQQFENLLKENENLLVDFWAPWCGPCRMIAPYLESISNKMGNKVKIVKINVDENRSIAIKYNIMSIPTVMFFKEGNLKDKFLGVVPETHIEDFINKNI